MFSGVGRLGLRAVFGGPSFSVLSLFANGEQGGWYDPSDLTTMFQDAAGTTAAALESPVGLVLDKSKGLVLGSELVTNGDFSNGTTDWTSSSITATASGGAVSLSYSATGGAGQFSQGISVVAGRTYKVTANVVRVSGTVNGSISVRTTSSGATSSFLGGQTLNTSSDTNVSFYYLAASTTTVFVSAYFFTTSCATIVDNISVRELSGNHLSQSTSTARPVLSARVNLLTYTEQFDNAYWGTASRVSIFANTSDTTDPLGGSTADKMVEVAATGTHRVSANGSSAAVTGLATVSMKSSVYFKKGTREWAWINCSDLASNGATAWFDLANGDPGIISTAGTGSDATSSITPVGNGWYLCSLTVKPSTSAGDVFAYYGVATADNVVSYFGDTSEHIYIWGADLRPSNAGVGLPAYQRVVDAATYDTAGFPYYIKHDGIDDRLLSANGAINTAVISSAIGTVFSDPARVLFGIPQEATAHTAPYFRFLNFIAAGPQVNVRIDGVSSSSPTSSELNKAYVLETYTAASRNAVIQNGSTLFTPTTATITYPNSTPLIVGANAVGGEVLNGGWYNLVIIGRDLTDAERTNLRTYMNSKCKAY